MEKGGMMGRKIDKARQYWQKVMDSAKDKISCGSGYIDKVITFAKGDNWRRKQKVKKHKKD